MKPDVVGPRYINVDAARKHAMLELESAAAWILAIHQPDHPEFCVCVEVWGNEDELKMLLDRARSAIDAGPPAEHEAE